MKYSRAQIQAIASAAIREHGMHLVAALQQHDYGASNLIALMEIFAEKLEDADEIEQPS